MNRSTAYDPEALYDKPHSVDLAQVMMVFEYFMLVSTTIGLGPRVFNWLKGETSDVPLLADVEAKIDVGTSFPLVIVLPLVVVLTVPYVMAVLDLGRGRHWARVAAFVFVPAGAVIGIVSVGRTYGQVPALVVAPLWIAVGLTVLLALTSYTARQWFRQGGWEPWYLRYEIDQMRRRRRPVRRRRRGRSLDQIEDAD